MDFTYLKHALFLLAVVPMLYSCSESSTSQSNSTSHLYHNGEIITMESDEPVYIEALVVTDGVAAH